MCFILKSTQSRPCTSRQAMENNEDIETESLENPDDYLKTYTVIEMNEMAKDKLFPPKYFKFGVVYKPYTPVLHFFDHIQVNNLTIN